MRALSAIVEVDEVLKALPSEAAHAIKCLGLVPGSAVLEFGSLSGETTIALAKAGMKVATVDAELCERLLQQASLSKTSFEVSHSDLRPLLRVTEPVDAVIFFGAFPLAAAPLLDALDGVLKSGGKAVFATPPLARDEVVTALARAGWTAQQNGGALEVKRRKMWSFEFKGAARELRSEVGSKTRSTLRAKSTRPAFLLFGPFCSLPKGQWTATLTLRSSQPTGHCVMEVSGGGQVFASRSLELRTPMQDAVALPFVLDRHEPLLEVRLLSGDDPVEVEIVQLEICAAF